MQEESARASVERRAARLRVGLLVECVDLPAWEYALVERLKDSPYLDLALVVLCGPLQLGAFGACARCDAGHSTTDGIGVLARMVLQANRLLEHRLPLQPDAFAVRDGVPLLSGIRTTRASPAEPGTGFPWSPHDLERVRACDLDVIVCLSTVTVGEGLASLAKHGVWSLCHGDERSGYGNPTGFWEVYFGSPVIGSSVQILSARYPRPVVACRSFSATDMTSVRRNNNHVHWKAVSLITRKLEELQRTGAAAFFGRIDGDVSNCSGAANVLHAPPSLAQLAAHVSRIVGRGLRNRLQETLYLPQWLLLFRFGEDASTRLKEFAKLVPPKSCFWADPFVLHRDGRHYIFFEELPFATNRGHICMLEIDQQGRHTPPIRVLERPYHLSYPALLEHEGELLMIPETAENRTIEVYRCTNFPDRWELADTLMTDVCAVDATVLRHGGKWWLFANMVEKGGGQCDGAPTWDALFLFSSESLLHGEWTPHPLNPIVSDVRRARPAGPIFEKQGKLYRPSQDCSVRYGYGIRLNQITRLTTEDYAEMEAEAIGPTWDRKIIGTHHLCRAGLLTVSDALQRRRRI